jgi:A/G-specific adenine glycosylase
MTHFATRLITWQRQYGRHDLPWQNTRDPYAVWLSEIMLQQTQVTTVIPYYQRFLARFPDIASLANATEEEVLTHWSGLGYYSRARNLQRAAGIVADQHGGRFPTDVAHIEALPGIGRSTAAAIAVFAFGQKHAILDGNVKRVLARHGAIAGYSGDKKVEGELWQLAETLLPQCDIEIYTQALMDLGASVCARTKPSCTTCPVNVDCVAHLTQREAEFPASRPRKEIPLRQTVMLILLHGREVFLEKRPPTGIWGGLWSFPEIAEGQDTTRHCLNQYGIRVEPMPALPTLRHTFTHFRLDISPQPMRVISNSPAAFEAAGVWLDRDEAAGAAIPTPVRRLLAKLDP